MDNSLYMIATPIGNVEDVTLRAKRCFQELEHFFAEDTREFTKLLALCGVSSKEKRLHSYASHNMKEATEKAIEILKEGKSIGFVSDRGTPGVSDPGALLVARAREEGFSVIPVPGASSVTSLVSVSGLSAKEFLFTGFFPEGQKQQLEWVEKVKSLSFPVCFFESPRRMGETVKFLKQHFPQGRLLIGREMTKTFEEYNWISLEEVDSYSGMEKGEFALILDPGPQTESEAGWKLELEERMISDKEWSKKVAARHGVSSSTIYNALQQNRREKV